MITSRSNPKIKFLESLRESKHRKREGLFLVEGEREISRAGKIKSLYFYQKTDFIEKLEKDGVELVLLSQELLERISIRKEMIAIKEREDKPLSSLKGKFFVALVGIEKPGNIGAILRTCDGCGVDGVLLVDPLADHFHPNAIRASLGACFSLDIVTCSSLEALSFAKKQGALVLAASPDAKETIFSAKVKYPVLLAFGAEDKGLPESWMQGAKVSIPMKGICDSLNVSVSAGILLYEVLRQNES